MPRCWRRRPDRRCGSDRPIRRCRSTYCHSPSAGSAAGPVVVAGSSGNRNRFEP
ncbi:MAG: CxxxxCH/CxxCH domain-containing protein [Saprospiraceae bacterium]|nr:CxxxxCH/CxxCH domain-containing protein [Saprospiraceae bacterium]MCB0623058.1 CxxxxCH/CxxCH domain-containing protein [Saprospiraceae bacterium]MCB0677456.1 CxxxxCH/CxxCH domain-containing protein [Saprospiraceae bacterium]MCB0679679.1 CxxxxCH/CxxCH domain-containing protein [Saprospiraceae bacterium]